MSVRLKCARVGDFSTSIEGSYLWTLLVRFFFEILHFQEASWTRLLGAEGSGVISEWKKGIWYFGENTGELTIGRRVKKHDYFQKKANKLPVRRSR